MNIVHITAECYPVAKVGGLADVVGSLPKYLNNLGSYSAVVMPLYRNRFTDTNAFEIVAEGTVQVGRAFVYRIRTLKKNSLGFDIFFVDIPELLYTDYVYSEDDTLRFLAFQVAALQWIQSREMPFDVVHCHDHHTGLIPFMMSYSHVFSSLKETPSILTIHNAQYQGWFSHERNHLLPDFDHTHIGLLDWDGSVNPLAAGIKCAWRVTTVSENYMGELQQAANGLEHLLYHERNKCSGILNGIDAEVWDPLVDSFLDKNYKDSSVLSGKKANKNGLCKEFLLDPAKPLFSFIGRLVGEKGADLLPGIFQKALTANNISVLLLGSGNPEMEQQLQRLAARFPGKFACYIGYDESLSHRIYAGSDFLLMPSRVEPCGLNQMYALRYGTVPIVHAVGGLKDTVTDLEAGGFGLIHEQLDVDAVSHAIRRAVLFYQNTEAFKKNRNRIMKIDHSWNASAKKYIQLYNSIT